MKTQKLKDKAKSANAATANETTESATITGKTMVKLADFVENPDNPSTATEEEIARLAGKLKRVPLGLTAMRIAYVTDRTGAGLAGKRVVISGNKRLRCLKAAFGDDGYVPAEWFADVTAMSEAERHEFIVSANVSDGSWDVNKLLAQYDRAELGELMGAEAVEELLADVEEVAEEGQTDEDAVPEVPQEPKSRRGAVYQLGRHRVMCGDSTSEEDVARLMDGELADLVVTDPPYNVSYQGGTKDKLTIVNDSMTDDAFVKFLTAAFTNMCNSMRSGAAFYIWHAQGGGIHRFFSMAVASAGLLEKQTLIWVKDSLVLGRQDYQWIHEPCLYGWKDGAAHYFIDRRDLTTVTEDRRDLKKMKLKELRSYCEELLARGQEATSIIREPKPTRNGEHPTMKPVRIFAVHMRNSSRIDEIVLDPFGGSGTAVIAAEQLDRQCRTMEFDPKYCDVIRRRWAEFVHGEGCDWESLTPEIKEEN